MSISKVKANIPPQIVIPKIKELKARCSNCQGYNWKLHVKPIFGGNAITTMICAKCNKMHKIDDRAIVQASAKKVDDRMEKWSALNDMV